MFDEVTFRLSKCYANEVFPAQKWLVSFFDIVSCQNDPVETQRSPEGSLGSFEAVINVRGGVFFVVSRRDSD